MPFAALQTTKTENGIFEDFDEGDKWFGFGLRRSDARIRG